MHANDVIDMTRDDARNPFIESYNKSIQPTFDIIQSQWKECKWDGKNLEMEQPATSNEV